MFIEKNIHIITTKDPAYITKDNSFPNLPLVFNDTPIEAWPNSENYHLYVLSAGKLEDEDWFLWYSQMRNVYEIHKFHSDSGYGIKTFTNYNDKNGSSEIVNWSGNCGKIVATTNSIFKLPIPDSIAEYPFSYSPKTLPQIPVHFTKYFVEEYNKSKRLIKVLIEYFSEERGLVTDSKNTVNIRSLKNYYTREELVDILVKCCGEVSCEDGVLLGKTPAELFVWIQENII